MESENSTETNLLAVPGNFRQHNGLDLYQYLCSNNFDTQNLCRVCLAVGSKEMYPLLSSKGAGVLANMYTTLTSIQVDCNDGLPKQICSICQIVIIQFHEFKAKCENACHTLKSLLKRQSDAEKELTFSNISQIKEEKSDEVEIHMQEELAFDEQTFSNTSQIKKEKSDYLEVTVKVEFDETGHPVEATDSTTVFDDKICEKTKTEEAMNTEESIVIEVPMNTEETINSEETINTDEPKTHFECPLCTESFPLMNSWKDHMMDQHRYTEQYYCDSKCSEFFNSEQDFKLHLIIHTKGPRWECPKCSQVFRDNEKLRQHLKVYKITMKYVKCEICSKSIAASDVPAHSRSHRVGKSHRCNQCGKTFATTYLLRNHRAEHIKPRPYECDYCGKLFSNLTYRNVHTRLHTGKGFFCEHCDKVYPKNSELRKHMHRKHKTELESSENNSESRTDEPNSSQNESTAEKSAITYEKTYNVEFVEDDVNLDEARQPEKPEDPMTEESISPEESSNAITGQVDVHHWDRSQLSASITTISRVCANETGAKSDLPSIRGYPKTAAERMKAYRARKKKEAEILNQQKHTKSHAERAKEYRARKKAKIQSADSKPL